MDDQEVSRVKEEEVLNCQAYLLFYRRRPGRYAKTTLTTATATSGRDEVPHSPAAPTPATTPGTGTNPGAAPVSSAAPNTEQRVTAPSRDGK